MNGETFGEWFLRWLVKQSLILSGLYRLYRSNYTRYTATI